MNKTASPLIVLAILTCLSSVAIAAKPIKVMVIVRGVHCDRCVKSVSKSLAEVKGIKFDVTQITRGARPRYFSEPFVIELADAQQTSIGSLRQLHSEAAISLPVANRQMQSKQSPDLQAIIDAWQALPDSVKADILATVKAGE